MPTPPSPLRLVGRDVLFVHWPVPVDDVREMVPEPLTIDTVEGSAWLSVLAHEVSETRFASIPVSRPFVQVNVRTYVRFDGDPGVYFISLDTGNRVAAEAARRLFGLPFRPARGSVRRRDDGTVTLRSQRAARREPQARFDARYRPTADPAEVDPDSTTGRLVERHRYFVPNGEAPALALALAPSGRTREESGVLIGEATRDPWRLAPVDAIVRTNTLFDAAGLDTPDVEPTVEYSPRYESRVVDLEFVSRGKE
jgi:uncharacterized protein YqjF (DUF2071 family)